MNDIIKLLDENLVYINHEIIDDTINIRVESTRHELKCPYCHSLSTKVHSRYERSFQDLPMQGKKVIIIINNRKFFCHNKSCEHKTFAETYSFLSPKRKKTKRLENKIVNVSMNVSSVTASNILSKSVVKVGKSTICKELHMDIRVFKKLSSLYETELKSYFNNTLGTPQEVKRSRKIKLVDKARKLYKKNYSLRRM